MELFGALLPRHLEIIYEINRRFLDEVRSRFPATGPRAPPSIIDEGGERRVRMAHLAVRGQPRRQRGRRSSTRIAARPNVLRDFYEMTPEKFSNKTNGVTPRRWMALATRAGATCSRAPRRRLDSRS